MAFTSVENDSGLMREGEYEVYVLFAGESETKSGRECIKFEFIVRKDVDQDYKGKHIFKQFYRDKVTNQWPAEKIGKYANALGVPRGEQFELEDLIGRNCRAVMKHFDGDDGVTRETIFYLKPSEAETYVAELPKPGFEDVDDLDDELPF